MQVTFNKEGNALVVAVKGRLDALTAPDFESQCSSHIEQGHVLLVADLTELEYISSAGLRSILQISKKLKQEHGQINFCCLSGIIQHVFSISGFDSMFSFHDSVAQALLQYER
ncbi:MAG: STAS domain-containing protein [Desulforhabdus sp.]|jgi:anti-sigma B factor antagonist|nr:STAS domain-containing protein [Desulforhabdus sp.]